MSAQQNRQLNRYVSKVIKCLEPNKWTDYKIFELTYGNTKLLGNAKHNQIKLILAVFISAYLYQYSIQLY